MDPDWNTSLFKLVLCANPLDQPSKPILKNKKLILENRKRCSLAAAESPLLFAVHESS